VILANKTIANGEFQPLLRQIGFEPESVFTNPHIKPWRKLPDRENCVWALDFNGEGVRWHVKRYPSAGKESPARKEAGGITLLNRHQIPTAKIVVWGELEDGRSFIILEDLANHRPADKLLESGYDFDRILEPTAKLAADLHNANLHHRDLYLCHFMIDPSDAAARLIDAARVAELPRIMFRHRWIVKDLSQFWYSTFAVGVTDAQRTQWLQKYAEHRKLTDTEWLHRAIARKSDLIARHDQNLRRAQPNRNISIPE
jgi:hypothetical protein